MENQGFRERLKERQAKTGSLVCVGLDPLLEKIPSSVRDRFEEEWKAVVNWMIRIVDHTSIYTSMYKLQSAHYESIENGRKVLHTIVDYIRRYHPDIPIFLDCKRADIKRTQSRYGVAHFAIDKVDGINFNPYMGKDCMSGLVYKEAQGKALVGLCYTSNESARETQDILVHITSSTNRPLWEYYAMCVKRWAEELGVVDNAGLVMAAAYERDGKVYSEHLRRCRQIVGDSLWFLIPGIGTQGGLIKETVEAAFAGYGSIAINSSSKIIFASDGKDYAEAAALEAHSLYNSIKDCLV